MIERSLILHGKPASLHGRPGAVIIGAHINGLGVLRALAARGVPCAVVRTKPYDIAHRSRFAHSSESAMRILDEPESLIEMLERRARDWRGWAVMATCDEGLLAISRWKERLSVHYNVLAPSFEAARPLLDKQKMLELAVSAGLDLPRFYGIAGEMDPLPDSAYPVLVKPLESHRFSGRFGCKLFAARTRQELETCCAAVSAAGLRCGVFDMVPGPDNHVYAYSVWISRDGEPGPGLAVRKIRQSPHLFGVARVAEIVPAPRGLREATVELLRRAGFRGAACAEFKFDPRDSTFRFLEVNGRTVIYNALLRKAGLDLAAMAWAERMEGKPPQASPAIWPGVWVNLHADLLYSALRGRREALAWRDFIAPYRRPMLEAVWSASDPGPFLTQWRHTLWRAVRRPFTGSPRPDSVHSSPQLETSLRQRL